MGLLLLVHPWVVGFPRRAVWRGGTERVWPAHAVVFIAPDGRTFTNGSPWTERSLCLTDGETNNTIDSTLN